MALWTDRKLIITQTDIADVDSDVAQIISVEQTPANRILAQAIQEAAVAVESMMQSAGPIVITGGLTAGHLQAVFNTGVANLQGLQFPRVSRSQVVITSIVPGATSPLKSWLIYRCLSAIMRDVCERKDSDRYKVKWDRIESHLQLTAEPLLRNTGMPVVSTPLAAPAAEMEPEAGAFGAADLSFAPFTGAVGGAFDVAVTYTGAAYSGPRDRQNSESFLSPLAPVTAPADQLLTVSIARLTPPDGKLHYAYMGLSPALPMAATGWNVWVGSRGGKLYLQNAAPIPIATQTYTLAADPTLAGYPSHEGQWTEGNVSIQRMLFRG